MLRETMLSCIVMLVALIGTHAGVALAAPAPSPIGLNLNGMMLPFADMVRNLVGWMNDVRVLTDPRLNRTTGLPITLAPQNTPLTLFYPDTVTAAFARPANWPKRNELYQGKWVLTWAGCGDVRLQSSCVFLNESVVASPSLATGTVCNGRRMYNCTAKPSLAVLSLSSELTALRASMPDPADPWARALELELWHPWTLSVARDSRWNHLLFYDWTEINSNPQRNWTDRRLPAMAIQNGVLNGATSSPGLNVYPGQELPIYRNTGLAYEWVVAFANAAGKSMWISVPHLAGADERAVFATQLARLILYGSNGTDPYTSPQAAPVWAPLDAHLDVFVEYSAQLPAIYASSARRQGAWLANVVAPQLKATAANVTARYACRTWAAFDAVFGAAGQRQRVKRVLSTEDLALAWSQEAVHGDYTKALLDSTAFWSMRQTPLFPNTTPDILAANAQFSFGTELLVYAQPNLWDFAVTDPYWQSELLASRVTAWVDEYKRNVLFRDVTSPIYNLARTATVGPLDLVTYSSSTTIWRYWDTVNDLECTQNVPGSGPCRPQLFLEAMYLSDAFAEVWSLYFNLLWRAGVRVVSAQLLQAFGWFQYLPNTLLAQPTVNLADTAVFALVSETATVLADMRSIYQPAGSRPAFNDTTYAGLRYGVPANVNVTVYGGDGYRRMQYVGGFRVQGVQPLTDCSDKPGVMQLAGVSTSAEGLGGVLLRALDGDGDPAWDVVWTASYGTPLGLLSARFDGAPVLAAQLPFNATWYARAALNYSGLSLGAGFVAPSGAIDALSATALLPLLPDRTLLWAVRTACSTLSCAISAGQYVSFRVGPFRSTAPYSSLDLRGALVGLTLVRGGYWAPFRFAVQSSIGGFTAASPVLWSQEYDPTLRFTNDILGLLSFSFTLPLNNAWNVQAGGAGGGAPGAAAVTLRLYAWEDTILMFLYSSMGLVELTVSLASNATQIDVASPDPEEMYAAWCPAGPLPSSSSAPFSSSSAVRTSSSSSAPTGESRSTSSSSSTGAGGDSGGDSGSNSSGGDNGSSASSFGESGASHARMTLSVMFYSVLLLGVALCCS